jgi:predicted heme/steroid binding protein
MAPSSVSALVVLVLLSVVVQVVFGDADVCVADPEEEKVAKPLRDFTVEQLADFKGANCKEIYVSYNNIVFDVTSHRAELANHEEAELILGMNVTGLMVTSPSVREVMKGILFDVYDNVNEDVIVAGLLSEPMTHRQYTLQELRAATGAKRVENESAEQTSLDLVAGRERLDEPILLAFMGRVYDVSYGAAHLYGPGGHYSYFSGRDVSRAMVFYTETIDDRSPVTKDNVADFVAELRALDADAKADGGGSKLDSLEGWLKVYQVNRKYPVVGELIL